MKRDTPAVKGEDGGEATGEAWVQGVNETCKNGSLAQWVRTLHLRSRSLILSMRILLQRLRFSFKEWGSWNPAWDFLCWVPESDGFYISKNGSLTQWVRTLHLRCRSLILSMEILIQRMRFPFKEWGLQNPEWDFYCWVPESHASVRFCSSEENRLILTSLG